ncbi:MAG: glycosyltransferase family 39 protein [Spirochaetia bacterium]|nr:glycosyltransferase family 39 protein [Spirochaetota bacterium]MCX8029889.1 glycosyltransferase family 39 protein [Brevinematales bacterium]MDW8113267.1 glycosyltransferase family 39 protein [Spirochaetia bacterium]
MVLRNISKVLKPYLIYVLNNTRVFLRKILIIIPLIFIIIVQLLWVISDDSTPQWDEARHTLNSIRILDVIRNPGENSIIDGILLFYDFYTHLCYVVASMFHIIFGVSYDSATFSILFLWIPLLYFSVYGIAKILFNRDKFRAVLSAFVTTSLPVVIGYSKVFYLDVPMASAVAFAFYIILRTNFLLAKKSWMWVGIAIAMSFFTKQTGLIFIPYLLLVGIIRGIYKHLNNKNIDIKRLVNNYVLSILVGTIPIFSWILLNPEFVKVWSDINSDKTIVSMMPNRISIDSIIYYPSILINHSLYIPLFIFLTLGVISIIARKDLKSIIILIGYLIIPYVILTFLTTVKIDRYILPFVVVLGMIISHPFNKNEIKKTTNKVAVTLIVVISMWNILATNFGNILELPNLNIVGIYVTKNNLPQAPSSPKRGIEYNTPEMVVKFIGTASEVRKFEGVSEKTTFAMRINLTHLLPESSFLLYSYMNKVDYYGVDFNEKHNIDIVFIANQYSNLVSDKTNLKKVFEREIPDSGTYSLWVGNKLTNWLFFYDAILKNVIAIKITNISYENGILTVDLGWVSRKRAYGDILGILEIIDEKGNVRYVEVPNIIPQGGDGGVYIRRFIKLNNAFEKGEYRVKIHLKRAWISYLQRILYRVAFIPLGMEKWEEMKNLVSINSLEFDFKVK